MLTLDGDDEEILHAISNVNRLLYHLMLSRNF